VFRSGQPLCLLLPLPPGGRRAVCRRKRVFSFTTTLLISPYQNRELLVKTGEELGKQYGVEFLPRDFRPRFREGQQKARDLGLYIQKYCGCVFSEEERYVKPAKRIQ
jgi:predicted adenine nucleotide alpha hydrolase (AANH) superfamily ATPase